MSNLDVLIKYILLKGAWFFIFLCIDNFVLFNIKAAKKPQKFEIYKTAQYASPEFRHNSYKLKNE